MQNDVGLVQRVQVQCGCLNGKTLRSNAGTCSSTTQYACACKSLNQDPPRNRGRVISRAEVRNNVKTYLSAEDGKQRITRDPTIGALCHRCAIASSLMRLVQRFDKFIYTYRFRTRGQTCNTDFYINCNTYTNGQPCARS